jgi:glutamine synthetase
LHVHFSATTAHEDRAVLDDPDDEFGLSRVARSMIAGILAHGAALTALGATTVNSYKRFVPGSWAPTHITWAYASRGAFIRVPERQTVRRLEVRVGDGVGNPYMYLAAILDAALDGLERELVPPPPEQSDVSTLPSREQRERGLVPVPPSLDRALDALEADGRVRRALGGLIADEFIKIKRSEWESYRLHVGEWDREWYLERG